MKSKKYLFSENVLKSILILTDGMSIEKYSESMGRGKVKFDSYVYAILGKLKKLGLVKTESSIYGNDRGRVIRLTNKGFKIQLLLSYIDVIMNNEEVESINDLKGELNGL